MNSLTPCKFGEGEGGEFTTKKEQKTLKIC